MKRKIKVNC
nr:unnamed protein product [Callosobruchus analis]